MSLPPQLPSDPELRIWLIENSVRAYGCAWASLIPFAGLLLAPTSIIIATSVRHRERRGANPARGRRKAAVWISILALIMQSGFLIAALRAFGKSLE